MGCIIEYINDNYMPAVQCQESYFFRITAFIPKKKKRAASLPSGIKNVYYKEIAELFIYDM